MGDLNLDFDIGTKVVSVGDTSSDNLGFMKDNTLTNLNNNITLLNLIPLAQRQVEVGIFSKVSLSILIFAF